MPRVLFVCSALVAVLQLPLSAAAPAAADVPVPAAALAFAASAGLTPDANPVQFLASLTRILYAQPEVKPAQIAAELRSASDAPVAAASVLVPVPLTADVWSRAVFRRTIAPADLVVAILEDRRAAWLCYGLAGEDDETLTFLAEHPAVLADLYDRAPGAFAAFGATLRIRGGRVVPPGAELGVPLWEAVVGERVDRPDRFVRALYADNDGRVAYLHDTIAQLDAPHAAFALGAWIPSAAVRLERFTALSSAVAHGYHEWRVSERPFTRPMSDFAIAMTRLMVEPTGAPLAPAQRVFWNGVFGTVDSPSDARDREEHGLIDAAFLADATGVSDMYTRTDRVEVFSFAQRVFGPLGSLGSMSDATSRDVATALKALPHQRMLMWALDRMGIREPSAYAAASRQAREVTSGDPNHVFWNLAQLQGSLALISRARTVGTIDAATAERLVRSVSAVPLVDGKYEGGIARWIEHDLLPALAPAGGNPGGAEASLIAALTGKANDPSAPRISWEGQQYRLDFAAAEARRLRLVRERQGGASLDVALNLARLAGGTPAAPVNTGGARPTNAGTLAALAENFSLRGKDTWADMMPPGVAAPASPRERIDRAIGDLSRVDEGRDPARAAQVASSLVDTADIVLSQSILSLVYALDLGDPDGAAFLASNVALRHDFGFGLHDSESRTRRPWDVPQQDFLPDVPWHVTGSLLGLDIALAPMALRHIDLDRLAEAPRLRSTEREAFAVGAALMDSRMLLDSDRAAIVAAIARGRQRIDALAANPGDPEDLAALADVVRLDGWRRRALEWTLRNRPQDAASIFSLAEQLALGGGAPGANVDAWGMAAFTSVGCACTRMIAPGGWPLFAGRPQLAFMSFVVSDLNLRVATILSEMGLPSALERPVLEAAVQDFIDEVAPADASDWLPLSQLARALTRQRVEDYVASAAAVDGPLVPADEPGRAVVGP
jgi:hypothetical protein